MRKAGSLCASAVIPGFLKSDPDLMRMEPAPVHGAGDETPKQDERKAAGFRNTGELDIIQPKGYRPVDAVGSR